VPEPYQLRSIKKFYNAIKNFWGKKYVGKRSYTRKKPTRLKNQRQQKPSMEWGPISAQGVTTALKTMLNWKASGRDQIANLFLKQPTVTHKCLATVLTNWSNKVKYRSD
jgi:hypothetical protein